jgi:hypothetical protein
MLTKTKETTSDDLFFVKAKFDLNSTIKEVQSPK